MSENIIQLKNISKTFVTDKGEFKALENVAEELGRYIRGLFKWLWKMYKKHINKGVSL